MRQGICSFAVELNVGSELGQLIVVGIAERFIEMIKSSSHDFPN
jgi:hypothetical protein